MISKEMEIKIPSGLDPSTIALFIQIASQYDSSVYVEVKNKKVNAKSIMGMMTLGVPAGGKINVIAKGDDETKAIEHIGKYLNNDLAHLEETNPCKEIIPRCDFSRGGLNARIQILFRSHIWGLFFVRILILPDFGGSSVYLFTSSTNYCRGRRP